MCNVGSGGSRKPDSLEYPSRDQSVSDESRVFIYGENISLPAAGT
jgi:hypothetical protein